MTIQHEAKVLRSLNLIGRLRPEELRVLARVNEHLHDQPGGTPTEQSAALTDAEVRQLIDREVNRHNLIAVGGPSSDTPSGVSQVLSDVARRRIFDHIRRLGSLQPFMDDPRVEEIVINGFAQVVIYREDRVEEIGELLFSDDGEVTDLVRRAIRWSGRDLNLASPLVTARLPDGSRLNAVIEPISAHGPSVAIRKFRLKDVRLAELVELGVLPFEAAEDLRLALASGVTLLFSGPTGSGKTTMLKALAATLRGIEERVITIEETGELDLPLILQHARAWEARPPNVDGKGEVTLRELVRTALRQRPKRLIIGEVRGPEALEMLLALDSGHDGSMGTIHANSPRAALKKLVMLASLADSPFSAAMLTETVAEVIGLVVHLDYLGSRRRRGVAEIFEATGSRLVDGEPVIEGQTLWEWSYDQGRLIQVGQPTRMLRRLAQRGIPYEKRPLPDPSLNAGHARTVRE